MKSSILVLAMILLPLAGSADLIHLTNGDRLTGTLVSVDGSTVLINVPWGDLVRIQREAVRSMESEAPLGVELEGGEKADYQLVATEAGEQGLRDAEGVVREVGVGALALVYRAAPGVQLAEEFRLDATYGLNITSGNADTQTHSVRGNLGFQRGAWRNSSKIEVDRKLDNSLVTKNQYRIGHQIDRFYNDDWYFLGTTEWFADTLKEVDYRFTLGAGVGRQFWNNSLGAFSAEAGATAVVEEIGGEQEVNPAFRASIKYNRFFLGKAVEFFLTDELLALGDLDRGQILNASTGLRFALSGRWKADARVDLVYETEPAAGNEKADVTYIFGVGYSL